MSASGGRTTEGVRRRGRRTPSAHPGGPRVRYAGRTRASASRAMRSPSFVSTMRRIAPPTKKKPMTLRIPARSESKLAMASEKTAGPAMPPNFSNTEKNPKNSPTCAWG